MGILSRSFVSSFRGCKRLSRCRAHRRKKRISHPLKDHRILFCVGMREIGIKSDAARFRDKVHCSMRYLYLLLLCVPVTGKWCAPQGVLRCGRQFAVPRCDRQQQGRLSVTVQPPGKQSVSPEAASSDTCSVRFMSSLSDRKEQRVLDQKSDRGCCNKPSATKYFHCVPRSLRLHKDLHPDAAICTSG